MRRFSLVTPLAELGEIFHAEVADGLETRFRASRDIAAPNTVLGVYQVGDHRELDSFRWAFIPSHARRPIWHMHDARAENVAERPVFADAFAMRRMLFLVDTFYLWQQRTRTSLVGYVFRGEEKGPLALAAIWNPFIDERANEMVRTCAVITTPANELVRPISERMPVVLAPDDYEGWIDLEMNDLESLEEILHPEDEPTLRRARIKGSTMRRM